MYANNVTNLDQILSSLQCYLQSARVRSDVYNVLRQIPSLQPNCGTFAHNDGTTSTLLNLAGTIPIFYRGNQYNIPMEFWMVETYPMAPPVCFVRPTADMMIKPGHPHVTNEGFVVIPYTSDWRQDYTLVELVAHLCSIFGNMPPVFRRPAQSTPQPPPYNVGYASASTVSYPQSPVQPPQQPPSTTSYYHPNAYAQSNTHMTGYAQSTTPYQAYASYGNATPVTDYSNKQETENLFGATPQPYGVSTTRQEDRTTSLKADATKKVRQELEKIYKRIRDDIDLQFEHQLQLTQSNETVEKGMASLRKLKQDLERANATIKAQDDETTKWLEEHEARESIDPDAILVEVDVLSKQLIDALAEHQAIEDALYYMDRALSNGEMELVVFLKEVRKLSRKQFMCQALVQKINETQQQQQSTAVFAASTVVS